jgi:hypothetical protein
VSRSSTASKSKPESKSKRERVQALPWAALLQVVVVIGRRWGALSQKDRARLTSLVRDSRGRLGNLSTKERSELRRLAGKLDLKGIGRDLLGLARGGGSRRRHRRGAST